MRPAGKVCGALLASLRLSVRPNVIKETLEVDKPDSRAGPGLSQNEGADRRLKVVPLVGQNQEVDIAPSEPCPRAVGSGRRESDKLRADLARVALLWNFNRRGSHHAT